MFAAGPLGLNMSSSCRRTEPAHQAEEHRCLVPGCDKKDELEGRVSPDATPE